MEGNQADNSVHLPELKGALLLLWHWGALHTGTLYSQPLQQITCGTNSLNAVAPISKAFLRLGNTGSPTKLTCWHSLKCLRATTASCRLTAPTQTDLLVKQSVKQQGVIKHMAMFHNVFVFFFFYYLWWCVMDVTEGKFREIKIEDR